MSENKIDDLFANLKEYLTLQVDILRLKWVSQISTLSSNLVSFLVLGFVAMMTLIFLSVTAAIYLSEVLGSYLRGFLGVSALYAFLLLLFVLFRTQLIRDPLRNKIVKEMLKPGKKESAQ